MSHTFHRITKSTQPQQSKRRDLRRQRRQERQLRAAGMRRHRGAIMSAEYDWLDNLV